jgi:hypothetical protein
VKSEQFTTGEQNVAESQMLCREQKIGLSAKSPFAESSPQQTIPLGKYVFAESNTLGKEKRSAKHNFPRALLSAKTDLRQKSPHWTVQTGVHSTSFSLPRATSLALSKVTISPSAFVKLSAKKHFAECLPAALGKIC